MVLVQDGPLLAEAIGLPNRPVAFALLGLMIAAFAFEVCLAGWKAAAVIGDPAIGFARSVRLTRGSY